MPWFRFDRDFDYRVPGARAIVAYKAGMVKNVPTPCMEQAEAKGAGRRTSRPHKKKAPKVARGS